MFYHFFLPILIYIKPLSYRSQAEIPATRTPAPSSTASTGRFLEKKTKGYPHEKAVTNCLKFCAKVAAGSLIGLRTLKGRSKFISDLSLCDNYVSAVPSIKYTNYSTPFSSIEFKRVPCPEVLTNRTGCIRDDEGQLTGESAAPTLTTLYSTSILTALGAIMFNSF